MNIKSREHSSALLNMALACQDFSRQLKWGHPISVAKNYLVIIAFGGLDSSWYLST